EIAERLEETHAVIAARWLGHAGKLAVAPRKLARLDQHATHRRAVTADVLGRGVQRDIGAELERLAQIRRCERVVDDQGDAGILRDRGDSLYVEDVDA